jgi:periplasmic divalent cation tolerance protein
VNDLSAPSVSVDVRLVYVSCPDEACARDIGRKMVERRLAACANVIPRMTSIYRWEGALEEDKEALLLLKTVEGCLKVLVESVRKIHPYRLPCIVAYPAVGGLGEYLGWIEEQCRPRDLQ